MAHFIIANGDEYARRVPGAHRQTVQMFYGGSPHGECNCWVVELTAEELIALCRRNGGHLRIYDKSVSGEPLSNSLNAPDLILW